MAPSGKLANVPLTGAALVADDLELIAQVGGEAVNQSNLQTAVHRDTVEDVDLAILRPCVVAADVFDILTRGALSVKLLTVIGVEEVVDPPPVDGAEVNEPPVGTTRDSISREPLSIRTLPLFSRIMFMVVVPVPPVFSKSPWLMKVAVLESLLPKKPSVWSLKVPVAVFTIEPPPVTYRLPSLQMALRSDRQRC